MPPPPFDPMQSLARLARRLNEEHTSGVFDDALELLLTGSGARHGAIYLVEASLTGASLEPAAERLGDGTEELAALRETALSLAEDVVQFQRRRVVPALLTAAPPLPEAARAAALAQSALALPIEHARTAVGALVLFAVDAAPLAPERLAFLEAATHSIGLAIHRDRNVELEGQRREATEEANRMAGLGLLTGTVALELRGPVGALLLQLQEQRRLLREAESGDGTLSPTVLSELLEVGEDLDTALARVATVVEQLARMSRHDSMPAELDLAQVVRESLEMARPYLRRRGIQVTEHLESTVRTVGRRDNLGQVLLNLVFNAADASEQVADGERKILVSVLPDGDRAVLQVDDAGPGIPQDAIRTIFAPFYTTKKRGKGTGLGLKICADVVAAHGGHIEVANRPQGGASFRVFLPRQAAVSSKPPAPAPRSVPPTLSRLLVIDDDPVFVRAVARGLKEVVVVDTALTASEGEIRLADPACRPDLVLCDIHLPGLNGHALHARVAARDPELASRFVFCTGGALSPEEAAYVRDSGSPTLFKPLNLDDVRELMAESADSVHQARTLLKSVEPPRPGD